MRPGTDIQITRARREHRVRLTVRGTADRPRLSVFRSHRHISAQLIDDTRGETIASASDRRTPIRKARSERSSLLRGKRTVPASSLRERAGAVGAGLARQAIVKGVRRVKFDRGRYRYHGLVRALAEGARKAGLQF